MTTHRFPHYARTLSFSLSFALAACSGVTAGDGSTGGNGDGGTGGDGVGSGTVGAVCGNNFAEAVEACDGNDLRGMTCADQQGYVSGTLACAADCSAFDVSMCEGDPMGAIVRLNEVTSADIEEGTYAGAGDAIELVNIGAEPLDISGWQLSDDGAFPPDGTYVFPAASSIAPGEFLVLIKLDEDTGEGDYPFGISGSNPETISLADAEGAVVDSVSFEGGAAEVSWCRIPDGDGAWASCSRTFGASNEEGSVDGTGDDDDDDDDDDDSTDTEGGECGNDAIDDGEDCDGSDLSDMTCEMLSVNFDGGDLACADNCEFDTSGCTLAKGVALVVVNELASSGDDEVELYNAGDATADLSGWFLTDELSFPGDPYDPELDEEELEFADGTTLDPGEYMVIIQGNGAGEHPFGLGGGGDSLTLLDADLDIIDFVEYGDMEAATSYCRLPDGPKGDWTADCTATFGATNSM